MENLTLIYLMIIIIILFFIIYHRIKSFEKRTETALKYYTEILHELIKTLSSLVDKFTINPEIKSSDYKIEEIKNNENVYVIDNYMTALNILSIYGDVYIDDINKTFSFSTNNLINQAYLINPAQINALKYLSENGWKRVSS